MVTGYGEIANFVHLSAAQGKQALALHGGMHAYAQPVADCRSYVAGLHESLHAFARGQARAADNHGSMGKFFIRPGAYLTHQAVPVFSVAHGFAVVGNHHEQRIFLKAQATNGVHEDAEIFVAQGNEFGIQHTHMVQFFFRVQAFDEFLRRKEHGLALVVGVIGAGIVQID